MAFKNKKIQKIISSLMVITILAPSAVFFAAPRIVEADVVTGVDPVNAALTTLANALHVTNTTANVTNTAVNLKDLAKDILKQALMAVAKRALKDITNSTVAWINTGFQGKPLFVENPKSFFNDVTKSEIKDFITLTGYDSLKYPFGKQYALNLISTYNQTLESNAAYSLSKVSNDPVYLSSLRTDFNTGGWDAFFMNTQVRQNNPIGYTLTATQKIRADIDANKNIIDKTLQQGAGFLSPQTCPSNPSYNSLVNQFNKPDFTPPKYNAPNVPATIPDPNAAGNGRDDGSTEVGETQANTIINPVLATYNQQYAQQKADAYAAWAKTNTCPGGLVNTTPGSVAAGLALRALSTNFATTELGQALGSSLSAVFDALLTRLTNTTSGGLNSLASTRNKTPQTDTFNYYGNTLGVSDASMPWSSTPDETLNLAKFKADVNGSDPAKVDASGGPILDADGNPIPGEHIPGGIELTQHEITLIDNLTPSSDLSATGSQPGLLQILDKIWPLGKQIDVCLPGPDKGWEKRLDDERDRVISTKLVKETTSDDVGKVKASTAAINELRFATASFKDWVTSKMILSLPDAPLFLDAVKSLDDNYQQTVELTNTKRNKVVVLARLKSISAALKAFPDNSVITPGSAQEKQLINLRNQYDSLAASVSTETSIEDTQSQLDLAVERLANMRELYARCQTQRLVANWQDVIDPTTGYLDTDKSILPSAAGQSFINLVPTRIGPILVGIPRSDVSTGSEKEIFCKRPIISGYSHGDIIRLDESNNHGALKFTFRNLAGIDDGAPEYEDLPMLNAQAVYGDETGKFDIATVDIECNTVYKNNIIDYKHAGDETF